MSAISTDLPQDAKNAMLQCFSEPNTLTVKTFELVYALGVQAGVKQTFESIREIKP